MKSSTPNTQPKCSPFTIIIAALIGVIIWMLWQGVTPESPKKESHANEQITEKSDQE